MQFHNGTSLENITNCDVIVGLVDSGNVSQCDGCRTLLVDGVLHIDFIPKFHGKHIARIPDDALISRDASGRVGIFIYPGSQAAHLLSTLWKEKDRQIAESN